MTIVNSILRFLGRVLLGLGFMIGMMGVILLSLSEWSSHGE